MSNLGAAAEAGADTPSSSMQARYTASESDEKTTQPELVPTTTASSASAPQYDSSPPPDGGITAWSQVLAAHLACVNTWGYSVGFAVFQLYYRETALPQLPASSISWIGSVQLLLAWTLSMVSGRVADMGYIRHLYFTGSMLVALGMLLTSICTEYWQFMLCQGVLNGVGAGLLFLPASANVGTYFRRNRGLAMATASTGASVGAVAYPAIVQYLTPRIGFGWSVRVCGFVSLALSACGLAVLRQRNLYRTPRPMVDFGAFRSTAFSAFCIAVFLLHFCLFPVMFYINSFAREVIHVSSLESINFVLIANGVAVLPRPIVGIVADRLLGAHNTYICTAVGFGALVYGWTGVRDTAGLYVFSATLGIANGATQGIFPGATSGLIARETGGDMSRMGTWMGMVFGVCGVASLAGPPAMGAIVAASGGRYIWAQVFFGTLLMASAGVLFAAPKLKRSDVVEKEGSS